MPCGAWSKGITGTRASSVGVRYPVPSAPLSYCTEPGCSVKVPRGRCAPHQQQARQHQRRYYTGTPGVNYGRPWQRKAKAFLTEDAHIWCVQCHALATEVDHRIPHKNDPVLFWDRRNWQPLCKPCHSAKTASELHHG
jgi:5-methylcytosine-specific restriction protein A